MRDLTIKAAGFNRIEFWAVTTIFAFNVFFFITYGVENVSSADLPSRVLFEEAGIPFGFYANYFFPRLIRYVFFFLAFLTLNFVVVPQLIQREALVKNVLLIILLFLLSGLVLGTTDTYLKSYLFNQYPSAQETYNAIFRSSFLYSFWLLLLIGFYSVIKYAGIYLLTNAETIQARYRFVTPSGLAAFVIWGIGLFLLLITNGDEDEINAAWVIIIPCGILLYWYSIHSLIPASLKKKRAFLSYVGKVMLIVIIAYLPVSFLAVLMVQSEDEGFGISLFNSFFQLLITAPLSWALFKRQMQGNQELYQLRQQLGQSHANFDFLRSQINPHFLFNALNTIYGTAIQEKAERTSEAVEKLGDMMRFMLQENMQEHISLVREIDYLENYIGLQKLRTDPSPGVNIQVQIEQPPTTVRIAPMLLIPFVENAFKHGISLREPSHITISLEMKGKTLHFDVHNSKHPKPENDPEKHKSGIGLSNVRQRLQLFYPGRYELMIRETAKEYFVHLTLQLG